jgi:transposase
MDTAARHRTNQESSRDKLMSLLQTSTIHSAAKPSALLARDRARQKYTLAEKLMIVQESQNSMVSQAVITRKYGLGKNVLWTWRKSLAGISNDSLGAHSASHDPELLGLQERVAELERLLGQKTLEIELLRSRLR